MLLGEYILFSIFPELQAIAPICRHSLKCILNTFKKDVTAIFHIAIESHMGIRNEQLPGQVKYQPQSNSFLYFSFIPL